MGRMRHLNWECLLYSKSSLEYLRSSKFSLGLSLAWIMKCGWKETKRQMGLTNWLLICSENPTSFLHTPIQWPQLTRRCLERDGTLKTTLSYSTHNYSFCMPRVLPTKSEKGKWPNINLQRKLWLHQTYVYYWGSNWGLRIRGTQVKSSGNKNWMSPSRSSNGAYFSETPPSWHVRLIFSLIAIVNY